MTTYLFAPPTAISLPIRGKTEFFPVNRIFCGGRNCHAHAIGMGRPVDKSVEQAFYFTKSSQTLVKSGATVAYLPRTVNCHFGMELVLAIGKEGLRVSEANARELVCGNGAGLDMTRRDLQLVARDKGRPWDTGKDIAQGSVCSEISPMPGVVIENGAIALEVNGTIKQSSNVDKLIWSISEIIADLSTYYHLLPPATTCNPATWSTPARRRALAPSSQVTTSPAAWKMCQRLRWPSAKRPETRQAMNKPRKRS